ncbi:MAG: hypothetical protein CMJ20_00630 [Phycisphaeraceae bacterium]|nr:hypothetical protein [Phycisphaeraceae bacterium]
MLIFIKSLVRLVGIMALVLWAATPVVAETYTFQQGANGYERGQDTSIRWAYTTNFADTATHDDPHAGDPGAYEVWSTNGGRSSVLEVGNFYQRSLGTVGSGRHSVEAGPTYRYSRMFIRFRDVFGNDSGQINPNLPIVRATLRLYNTEDLGAVVSAGSAAFGDTICCDAITGEELANPQAQPKLNAGMIAVYPSLIPISYGFDDGTSKKGKVTGMSKRRDKEHWARGKGAYAQTPNDPSAMAFKFGPADWDDPDIAAGEEEINSAHPGAVEIFQDATEGFKEFDVTGLMEFVTGDGVFITALSPAGELPTLDLNYGNAYRSSEFGSTYDSDGNLVSGASAADIATRPMLVVELVPEPGMLSLVGIGSVCLLRRRR